MFNHQRGRFYFLKKIISSVTLICFSAQPILSAAQVVADPNGGQKKPTIDATANGLPLVQITTPSGAGVSHNQYQQFNVGQQGLILNNARTVTQTQQAGFVDANPNLVNGSARIILNEVTSTNPSLLRGYTEVAGQRAEVIIANPNGITCNGCGFINTSRGVLTTGVPIMSNDNIDALQVTNGHISIEGLGFNTENLDQADLIARSVAINAGVWAQYLNVISGSNRVDYASLNVQALTPDANKPQFAIDVAALGGMYANRIRLVGTENGLGVNSQGAINSTGDLIVTNEGRVLLAGNATAGGNVHLTNTDSVTINSLYSQGSASINTQGSLTSNILLASGGNMTINAQSVDASGTLGSGLASNGEFSAASDLTLSTNGVLSNHGLIRSGGSANITAAAIANHTTAIAALDDLTLHAANGISNQNGTLYSGQNLNLTTTTFSNANGNVAANQDLSINAQNLTGTGKLVSGRDLGLALNSDFTNGVGGELRADRNLTINTSGKITNNSVLTADTVVLQSSSLENTDAITGRNIDVATTDITNSGVAALIASTEGVNLFAAGSVSNLDGANIYSLGNIVIAGNESLNNAANVLNSSATIQAEGNVEIYANQITNRKSIFVTEEQEVSRTSHSELLWACCDREEYYNYDRIVKESVVVEDSEPGKILAGSNMVLKGSIENNLSTIAAGANITFDLVALNNISMGTRTILKLGENVLSGDITYCRARNPLNGNCVDHGHRWGYISSTPHNESTTDPIGKYQSTFTANGSIIGSAININNITLGSADTPVGNIASIVRDVTTDNLVLPQGGLYTVHTDPTHLYLIETNSRFADFKTFISSDYMLKRLSYEPQGTMKRLGDGFYETQLVLSQITQLTGRRYLDQYSSAEDQYRALMDSGVANAEKFQLKVGIALDAQQIAQLTSDMVWMVEKEVKGQKVLVPVVYLARLKDQDLTPSGSLIAANDIQIFTSENLTNVGVIKGNTRTGLTAKNIVNQGGIIDGGITYLAAENDILNQSGIISGDYVALQAGRDIVNETTISVGKQDSSKAIGPTKKIISYSPSSGYVTTYVGQEGQILSRGDLSIQAGQDIKVLGAKISSANEALLQAGRNIKVDTVAQDQRRGVVFQKTHLTSEIQSGGRLSLVADQDIKIKAAQLSSTGDMSIRSGNNLEITAAESSVKKNLVHAKGHEIDETTYNKISTLSSDGNINLITQKDVKLEGAQVLSGKDLTLMSGGNVMISTVKDYRLTDNAAQGKKTSSQQRSEDETVIGSDLQAQGNVTIAALPSQVNQQNINSGNVLIEGSSVAAGGGVLIAGDKDVTIKEANERHYRLTETISTKKKNLGTTKVTKKSGSESESTFAVGSTISGDTVQISSSKDLNIQGSSAVATRDVSLSAAENVTIKSAEDISSSSSYSSVKKSGVIGTGGAVFFGAGVATYGTQHTKKDAEVVTVNQVGSTVGSLEGNVIVNAGKDYKQIASDVIALNDLSVAAQNIAIEAGYDTSVYKETTQFRQGGVTVGYGGGKLSTPTLDLQASEKRRHEVEDKRLKALYAYKELNDLYKMGGAIKNIAGGDFKDAASVKIDFGSSSSKSEVVSKSSMAVGSNLSGNNISLVATGDKNILNSGNLAIIGSNVNGQDILLSATNDITLRSAENKIENDSQNKSRSGSVGVSVGFTGDGAGITFSAQGSMSKGRTDGDMLTYTETQINAAKTLTVKSGRDTNLIGAQAHGEKIVADVGRDLNIVSQQDIDNYKAQQLSMSGGVSYTYGAGSANVNFSINKSKTNSSHQSVNEQSGFFAGKEGFDINVKGNTDLKGAVITSDAEAGKNKLSTETFTFSDIENKAEYKSSSVGVSASTNVGSGPMNPSLMPNISPVSKGKSNSMTLASIAQGSIEIRSDKNKSEDQKTDLSRLSRDPVNASKTLDKIFDQKKIEEQQELAKVFGQEAFKAVGDIAKHFTKPHEDAELRKSIGERYLELKNKGVLSEKETKELARFESTGINPSAAEQLINQATQDMVTYQEQYDAWKEGSPNKILLHAFVGAVQAGLGGGNAFAGGVGAGAGEAARQATEKLPPSLQQWASVAVGAAAAKLVGDDKSDVQTGAAASLDGERYNRQLHQSEIDKAKKYAKQFKEWLKDRGEDVTVEEAEGRLANQMLRWVDHQTFIKDGREDLAVTAFLGKNSVQVTEKDYYDFRVNQDVQQANQDIYALANIQKDAGYTFKEIEAAKNKTSNLLSTGVGFTPLGSYQDIVTAITGIDPVTGEEVNGVWRYLGLIPMVGELSGIKKGMGAADEVAGLGNKIDVAQAERVVARDFAPEKVHSLTEANVFGRESRGLIFVQEKVGGTSSKAADFDAFTTGAMSDLASERRAVPALLYENNITNGRNYIKFDGIENGNVLIDRKLALTSQSDQLVSINRASKALQDNPGYKLVYEFPDTTAANRAQAILNKQGVTNILVRVAKPKN